MNVEQTQKDENTLKLWILDTKAQMLFLTVVQISKYWLVQHNSVKNNY